MQLWRAAPLFTAAEAHRAFTALREHAAALYAVHGTDHPLWSHVHRRGGSGGDPRDHIELPLHHQYTSTAAYMNLPAEARLICAGLHDAAVAYAEEALQHPCVLPAARQELLRDLGRRSVLRVLRYPAGSGCRPHVDPGVCTALLVGSAGGLEVNTTDALPPLSAARLGDYTGTVDGASSHAAVAAGPSVLDALPHWEPVVTAHAGEAAVMAGKTLEVVSGGALRGVLHRVRRDWATGVNGADAAAAEMRFNVLVELRPTNPKRWYAAAAAALTGAEVAQVTQVSPQPSHPSTLSPTLHQ
ncbi:2OG-Fe(II) oxygenase superfamily [Novymonas esmeraldas]|uniref:2OG-Fe(II) oxygenase superfamily n=1 Tax=Novymonas esmeraldas TaxID=1808958 RepID=A0AAW0ES20_9TRYP